MFLIEPQGIPIGYTNQVLIEQTSKETIFYVPAYLRLKVKNFIAMNLDSLDAEMNATLIFTVFFGDIDEEIIHKLSENIVLYFNRNEALHLDQQDLEISYKLSPKEKLFTYTVRKVLSLRIQSNIFWSPFEIINLILTITLQSVNVQTPKGKFVIKFNLMDHPNNFVKISYTQEGTFGNYDLAQALMIAEYSHERIPKELRQQLTKIKPKAIKKIENQQENNNTNKFNQSFWNLNQKQSKKLKPFEAQVSTHRIQQGIFKIAFKKPKHFQYAHFTVPLYKYPDATIATIFLPLWLLGILNLGVFFQTESLADRIGSISAIMVAFVALIPTIRSQIPPNPTVTFVEILVYFETSTCFLCLIQSIIIRNQPNYQEDGFKDVFFIISLVITILNFIIVVIIFFLHKCYWEPNYNRVLKQEKDQSFNPSQWSNTHCDRHFQLYQTKIKIFSVINPVQETNDLNKMIKNVRVPRQQSLL